MAPRRLFRVIFSVIVGRVIPEEIGNVELKLKLPVETDAEGRWDQFLSNNPFLMGVVTNVS